MMHRGSRDGLARKVPAANDPAPRRAAPRGPEREPAAEPVRALRLARAAVAWERLWPALWPAACVLGLFLAAAWLNLLPGLGGWAHLAVLLGFLAAFASTLAVGLKGFRWPDFTDARRRLERDSDLRHRPLTALRDRPAGDDPLALALWRIAQERARRSVSSLTLRAPHPNVAARDPWAVRAAVLLLVVTAGTVAWGDWASRLGAAFRPGIAGFGGAGAQVALDLWVTPPDYTGQAPIFLTQMTAARLAEAKEAGTEPPKPAVVDVPVGSTVLARVGTGSRPPVLAMNGEEVEFQPVPGGGFQIDRRIVSGSRIEVTQRGRELGAWDIRVVPDQAPGITFRGKPEATERHALRIDYSAADDYGIAKATATVRLAVEAPPTLDRTPVVLPLPVPGLSPKEANASGFFDLTPHPWAGLPVAVRLEAVDAAGQTGGSPEQTVTLPERPFAHPVARAIITERKRLILGGDAVREQVATVLNELSSRPGAFNGDLAAFMALRSAVGRLMLDRTAGSVPSLLQLLWDTALRIEDGGLSIAERDLRDAERRLMEALDRGADDQELQRLMDELRQAMNQFLDAVEQQMRQAMERGEMPPEMPMDPNVQTMDRQDIEEMLQRMQELAQTGSKDAARQMLSELQQMLENMRTGQMTQQERQQAEQNQQMMQMMQDLQDLARRQQQLMDETYQQTRRDGADGQPQEESGQMPGRQMPGRQGARPQPGQEEGQEGDQQQAGRQGRQQGGQQQDGQQPGGGQSPGDMAARQEALRRELGDMMGRFGEMGGEIPRPLGRAERSMRDAGEALAQGSPGQAVQPQGQALDALRQGMQSMAEQMQQQMQQQAQRGMRPGQRPQQAREPGRDPLGRPLPGTGPFDSNDVKIPEQADLQRAREILDELRRRAGEAGRPRQELEYIERLLKRF